MQELENEHENGHDRADEHEYGRKDEDVDEHEREHQDEDDDDDKNEDEHKDEREREDEEEDASNYRHDKRYYTVLSSIENESPFFVCYTATLLFLSVGLFRFARAI